MIEVLNIDCMVKMSEYPDKYFDLAIVDPPYGIGAGSVNFINGTSKTIKSYFREFIKWKDANVIYYYEDCTYKSPKSSRSTIDELYQYWLNMVRPQ